jgi:hypothetical protein
MPYWGEKNVGGPLLVVSGNINPILGKSQNYGFVHFWNGFVYLCTQNNIIY